MAMKNMAFLFRFFLVRKHASTHEWKERLGKNEFLEVVISSTVSRPLRMGSLGRRENPQKLILATHKSGKGERGLFRSK